MCFIYHRFWQHAVAGFFSFFCQTFRCDETSNYLMHMFWKFSNKNAAIYCYCCVLWSSHVVMLIHKFSNLCVNSVSFILSLPSISLTELHSTAGTLWLPSFWCIRDFLAVDWHILIIILQAVAKFCSDKQQTTIAVSAATLQRQI